MTPDRQRLKEALEDAAFVLTLPPYDPANKEAFLADAETLRACLSTFEEREAFIVAAKEFGSLLHSLEPDDATPDKTVGGRGLREFHIAYRALVAKELEMKGGTE